ncbi:FAD-dependent oxidoreductase [Reticulibacter mediterranei]|uniref:FAD-dependent oxidoreductase n=1 Tax=Reticulibacter mediterranei TaxID=2778369 RepID=A0A8J3N5Y1_9CHLR|nr:FAD-dependent monooxygenase [Reticulibacter mediterranei]GHO96865.1 FAD-dependent oxidoreductase [Reticulibacter mediterranei]
MSMEQYDETVPVVIVGGSLVGLSTALFLAWRSIPCLLVERHVGISPFVRAGGFNPRTLEIYRSVGLEATIRAAAPEMLKDMRIVRVETLAGKELGTFLENTSDYSMPASPVAGSIIPQNILEPLLNEHARKYGADLRFNTDCVSCEQDADGVSCIIRDLSSGEERRVRARYLVAADGNKSAIRNKLGIGVQGPGTLAHQMNLLFRADVRPALRGRRFLVCFVASVQGMYSGSNDHGGILSVPYDPEKESEQDFRGERGVELIRAAVGIPDLAVEVLDTLTWEMADWLADHFQQGRIFLAGDSAHVMPPTGGYGANTGIADAHNLAWKLAAVINGQAGPDLLSTYGPERRAASRLAVEQAFLNYIERINPERAHQATVEKIAYDIPIFGYLYHSIAVCSEDTDPYEDANFPTGRPGARAPHIVLERAGELLSTLDLFGRDFILLTGAQGQMWRESAARIAPQLGLTLDTYGIDVDVIDVEGRFSSAYGVTTTGATLIRPDGFIAWRAHEAGEQPEQELGRVLRRVLCRS